MEARRSRSVGGFGLRSPRMLCVVAGLAVSPGVLALGGPAGDANQTLPIRQITLYRSGVGYFERAATIDGNTEVQLRFNTDQINDILKSMVLLDLDGGRVDSVSYASKEPLSKRLASFGINIADNPSLPQLLNQLRGAPVRVQLPGGSGEGTILGVEQRQRPGTRDVPATTQHFLNVVTPTGLRSINIEEITSFEILDKALADELGKALAALAEYRADRTKTVDLRFSGAGQRRIVVGYVHEMPVWKTSYRLVLPDADARAGEGEVLLQGWAIVENTTDQDWNGVNLSLVSGRPVSFQMDLYEPLFMTRPFVQVPTIPGVSPRGYALGVDGSDVERMGRDLAVASRAQSTAEMRRNVGAAPGSPPAGVRARALADSRMEADAMYNVDESGGSMFFAGVSADDIAKYAPGAGATPAEVGEVFQYRIDAPVSIERQRSAMLPILTTNIPGRRVSIYNMSDAGGEGVYPRRGVEITNSGGLQLLAGPISVLDGGTYAGDAQVGQIPKGDKRLLSYALDLNVQVMTKPESSSSIQSIRIVDGQFVFTNKNVNTMKYELINKDSARGRTVIIEHPKYTGWKLVQPAKPTEETKDLYRFEVALGKGGDDAKTSGGNLVVTQEIVTSESVSVTSYDLAQVVSWHKDGKLSNEVMNAVRQVADRQSAINQTRNQISTIDQQVNAITSEQSRIRENMRTIERTSQLYTRYMTKLTEQEGQIDTLTTQRAEAQRRLEQQQIEFNNFVRQLNVG
ncbi:MAG: hypothetical protein KF768_00420 [Phycisphaeraceae bacterium]|nr:hypothetical protein [Phycisphaeraceae bacterium]